VLTLWNHSCSIVWSLQLTVRHSVDCQQVADGTVHPLTAYSLSFLKRLFTYESSITVLFADPEATPGLART
jgi:Exo70 exocyst complex subunit